MCTYFRTDNRTSRTRAQMRCVELEGRIAVLQGERGLFEVQLAVAQQLIAAHAMRDGLEGSARFREALEGPRAAPGVWFGAEELKGGVGSVRELPGEEDQVVSRRHALREDR